MTKLRDDLENKLSDNLGEEEMNEFMEKIIYFEEKERLRDLERHRRKLGFWLKGRERREAQTGQTLPYNNLSKIQLNTHLENVLNLGSKFILEEPINLKDAIPKIENALRSIPENERDRIRWKTQEELEKKLKIVNKDEEDIRALKQLKKNEDIACIYTDKTGKIVILNKEDYINKMEETFSKMHLELRNTDPCKKLFNKVKDLVKQGTWPHDVKPYIDNFAPITPRAFGRYKDHKDPPKIRPIVNKKEGPTYCLEKYMAKIYKQLIPNNNTSLSSTEEFIKQFKNLQLQEGQLLVSFDVENLFPSINTTEINEIVNEELRRIYKNPEVVNTLIAASNLIIKESYFQFNNKVYKQLEGVPMGSPISGILAEIKLRKLEEIIDKKFKDKIKFWVRYVDDILAVIEKGIDVQAILEELNNIDRDIKFTIELEKENSINYLDVNITRKEDNEIETRVHRKHNSNKEIINAKCKVPYNYKIAAIRSYINRAIVVCSNEKLLQEEIKIIEKIAIENGYKKNLVQKMFNKRLKAIETIPAAQKQRKKFTTPIPYCRGAINTLKREAAKFNINIPIKPGPSIFQHVRSDKDKIDPLETSGIYRIEYRDNQNKTGYYIGLTKRKIKERLNEHKEDIRLARNNTAIARLANKNELNINYNKTKKLAHYHNKNIAYCREAIEIEHNKYACNDMEHYTVNREWQRMLKNKARMRQREVDDEADRKHLEDSTG